MKRAVAWLLAFMLLSATFAGALAEEAVDVIVEDTDAVAVEGGEALPGDAVAAAVACAPEATVEMIGDDTVESEAADEANAPVEPAPDSADDAERVPDPSVPVSVRIRNGRTLKLSYREKRALTAVVSPATAQTTLTWKSSNPKVVKVTKKGVIKGLKKGKATVTVKTANGKTAKIKVTVKALPMKMSSARVKYFRKYMNKKEFDAALDAAYDILLPMRGKSTAEKINGVVSRLYYLTHSVNQYTNSNRHYRDPYGVLVLHIDTCAGGARTMGFFLNLLGISYKHLNENKYTHQWVKYKLSGKWYIADVMFYDVPIRGQTHPAM